MRTFVLDAASRHQTAAGRYTLDVRKEIVLVVIAASGVLGTRVGHALPMGDETAAPAPLLSPDRLDAGQLRRLDTLMKPFDDPDAKKRRKAIVDVGLVGNVAVPFLKKRIDEKATPLVDRSCILALGEIGGEAALVCLEAVLRAVGSKLHDEEAAAAYLVLGRVGNPAVLERPEATDAITMLATAAVSKKPSLSRRAAVLALGRAHRAKELAIVADGFAKEPLEDQRVAILIAIANCADSGFTDLAISALQDRADAVRRAACLVLAENGDPRAVDALLKSIANERDEKVLAATAIALGGLADSASRAALRDLTQRTGSIRLAAFAALAARNDSVEDIAAFFQRSKDTELLARVALAAAASRSSKLDQPLIALLTHSRPEVRSAAGLALAARGTKGAEAAVVQWLKTEKDNSAHADALLVAGALELAAAKDALSQSERNAAHGSFVDQVRRTIEGRRDPRLLQAEVEKKLREKHAREWDLRCVEYAELVSTVFHFDLLARARVLAGKPAGGGDPGGGGDSNGGEGSGGSDDGSGEGGAPGSGAGSPFLKPKIDRKTSVLERDLELWFEVEPYFEARSAIR